MRLLFNGRNAKTSRDRDCSDNAIREMIKFIKSGPGRDLVIHSSWQHLVGSDDEQQGATSDNRYLQ